jgi:signal transduction histidine kinase
MNNMIDGILQYSRVGRVRREAETVDTRKVVERVVESISPSEDIRFDIQKGLPEITVDPVQIGQVFQNLIGNAVKFMDKPEGVIEVGCRDLDSIWEFYVKDNGPGIEERHFERIFQIFQSLKAREGFESTGLGLTIVKKIIETSGGRVGVESEAGNGSTFRFTVPKGKP